MIFAGNTRVYIYSLPVDMRNSIDDLSAKVHSLMGQDPFTGDLFVFSNRYHNMIKILYWHTNGFCLWMKRLERGRFKWPGPAADMFCVTERELAWLLEGLDFTNVQAFKKLEYTRTY